MTRSAAILLLGLCCVAGVLKGANGRPVSWLDGNQRLVLDFGSVSRDPTTGDHVPQCMKMRVHTALGIAVNRIFVGRIT